GGDATVGRSDPAPAGAPLVVPMAESALRDLTWQHVGVYRHGDGLRTALAALSAAASAVTRQQAAGASLTPATWRTTSLVVVASLIVQAALRREESRGGHSRTDFSQRDDLHWARRLSDVRPAVEPSPASS